MSEILIFKSKICCEMTISVKKSWEIGCVDNLNSIPSYSYAVLNQFLSSDNDSTTSSSLSLRCSWLTQRASSVPLWEVVGVEGRNEFTKYFLSPGYMLIFYLIYGIKTLKTLSALFSHLTTVFLKTSPFFSILLYSTIPFN